MTKPGDGSDFEKVPELRPTRREEQLPDGVTRITLDTSAPGLSVPLPEQRPRPTTAAEAGHRRQQGEYHSPSLRHTLPPGETVGPRHAASLLLQMHWPQDEEAGEAFPFGWLKDSGLVLSLICRVESPGLNFEASSYRIETLPGDEIWSWSSSPESWEQLGGRAGRLIARDGMVLGARLDIMS
jgi:hypothetical protein